MNKRTSLYRSTSANPDLGFMRECTYQGRTDVRAKERSEMIRHDSVRSVCARGKDERGTKWRGWGNLAWFWYVQDTLQVHLWLGQVPPGLERTTAAAVYFGHSACFGPLRTTNGMPKWRPAQAP